MVLFTVDDWPLDGVDNSAMLVDGGESNRHEMVYHINEKQDPFQAVIRYDSVVIILLCYLKTLYNILTYNLCNICNMCTICQVMIWKCRPKIYCNY